MTSLTRKLVWTETIDVRWGDMDAVGHVNNAQYFRYMEQARISWFESLGVKVSSAVSQGPVIASAGCEFMKPIVYPARLAVSVEASAAGNSSFPIHHRIASDENADLVFAQGKVVIVWIDYAIGRSVPLPDWLRAALA